MKIKCLMCNEILESNGFYHHDFKQCDCMNQVFIDQIVGTDQFRYGAKYMSDIEIIKGESK